MQKNTAFRSIFSCSFLCLLYSTCNRTNP